MKITEKVLWFSFYFLLLIIFSKTIGNFFGIQLEDKFPWFRLLFYLIPVILLVTHSIITLGLKRSLLFIFLAMASGTFFEYIGLKYGTFFGGNYVYKAQQTLFNVPVSVIIFWAVFIYTGYAITNSFFNWLRIKKPKSGKSSLLFLLLLILLDGYFVTTIDLFMDPIAVASGSWKWLDGGPYFGVPLGNFIGWFIVTITVVGIFRIFEYFFPEKDRKYDRSIFIVPVLSYGLMAISYVFLSLSYELSNLYLIGSLFIMPQVITNLVLYKRWKQSQN